MWYLFKILFIQKPVDNSEIALLDLLLLRKGNGIETTAYQKPTHNDMYLDWYSFAPELWKQETLTTLLLRAHIICCNQYLLKIEIKHREHVLLT